MEIIFAWQLVVAASIAISRAFSSMAMIVVAGLWTAWTFLAVWASGMMLLQLGTVWGTVWILSSLFSERVDAAPTPDLLVTAQAESDKVRAAIKAYRAGDIQADTVNGATTTAAQEIKALAATPPVKSSAITSTLDGVTSVANASTAALESFNKALDGINDGMQRQAAKMAANQEILAQLYGLRLSVEAVLQIAEKECETQRRLAADPEFAKIYAKLKEQLEGVSLESKAERRLALRAVTLAPQRPSELPPLAADERMQALNQCLELLTAAATRIGRDQELLQEIEKLTEESFKDFLLRQSLVLWHHRKILCPTELLGQDPTVNKTLGSEARETTLTSAQTISQPKRSSSLRTTVTEMLGSIQTAPERPKVATQSNGTDSIDMLSRYIAEQRREDALPVPGDRVQGNVVLDNSDLGRFRESAVPAEPAPERERKDIEIFARELGIPHLVHFTRCENLAGILKHGLVSIATCDKEGLPAVRNDTDRLDGQPDGISLSIAFPNYLMFYKYRQVFKDADWAVLLFSPRVMWEKDCGFYRYNAADARVSREQRDKMKSLQAFRDMFVEAAGTREASLRRFDPSDPQAEILVYETIPSSYLEAVAFETREVRTKHMDVLGGLESFYAGTGKGLFSARSHVRST